jgi:error-prone DNA polymerase
MDGRDKPGHDVGFYEEGSKVSDAGTTSLYAFWRRTGIRKASLVKLAEADAFGSLGLSRRQALWEAQRVKDAPLPLFAALERPGEAAQHETHEDHVTLPAMPQSTEVVEDYRSVGLSLKNHPFAFLRDDLTAMGCRPSRDIPDIEHGTRTRVAGMVLVRQRPGSASGVIFITLEDEFGIVNIIVWPSLFDRFRREILTGKFLAVEGKLQREGLVVHIVAEKLSNITYLAEKLDPESREFTLALARADEVTNPGGDRRELIVRRRKELAAAAERLKIKSRDFH